MTPSALVDRVSHFWSTNRWYLLYSDQGPLKSIEPAQRTLWADPFITRHQGRTFVFFEECPYRFWGRTTGSRGRLCVMEYLGSAGWSKPVPVLERPYHLSYPFVFRWNGRFYLLPETLENRTIELYEEEEFPYRWRLHRTIMSGVSAVDTTLHEQDGLWWMFTCRQDDSPPNRDLYLYHSEDPVDGEWKPHPANPVVSDFRYARPAGRIFHDGSAYIRPAQDCSNGYGGAVEFRRILRLDRTGYEETSSRRLGPESIAGAGGVHTWNEDGGLRLTDARKKVARWRLT